MDKTSEIQLVQIITQKYNDDKSDKWHYDTNGHYFGVPGWMADRIVALLNEVQSIFSNYEHLPTGNPNIY